MYAGFGGGPQSNRCLDQFLRVIFPVEWEEYASNVKCMNIAESCLVLQITSCPLSLAERACSAYPKCQDLDDHYDYIVIGSGHAGSCAAHSTAEHGCTRVLLLDKCPEA
jgi:FAD binding domain